MCKFTFNNKYNVERLKELQRDFDYPECSEVPMTQEEIKNLKPGTSCYVISSAGLKLCVFSGHLKYRGEIGMYTYTGSHWYKVKNAGKTYNVYKLCM